MEYEQIRREQRDDVVVLTLNRPDRINAWTPQMTAELTDAIEAADADRTVGSVVLTGAGRGFSAGADIERGVRRATARRRERGRAARRAGLGRPHPCDEADRRRGERRGDRHGSHDDPAVRSHRRRRRRQAQHPIRQARSRPRTREHDVPAAALRLGNRVRSHAVGANAPRGRSVRTRRRRRGRPSRCRCSTPRWNVPRSYGANPSPQLRWIKQLLTQDANETDPRAVQAREIRHLLQAYTTPEHKEAIAAYLEHRDPNFR